jgi:anti-sigma B factor antagonist
MPLKVTVQESNPRVFTVSPVGSLDSNTAPALEEQLRPILARGPRAIVLDLAGLEYISSAGVRVVVATRRSLKGKEGKLLLINLPAQIRKVFEIIQALPSLNVFESVAELDEYLKVMQDQVKREGN